MLVGPTVEVALAAGGGGGGGGRVVCRMGVRAHVIGLYFVECPGGDGGDAAHMARCPIEAQPQLVFFLGSGRKGELDIRVACNHELVTTINQRKGGRQADTEG